MSTNKQILIGMTTMIAVLLITIGLSYAYFSANLTGGEEATTITVTGGTMNIVYNGGASINVANIIPSDNPVATKTFTVTGNNTTDIEMKYQISLIVEENTFSEEALKYKLISTNTDNNGEVVPSINELTNIGAGTKTILLGVGEFASPTSGNKVHTYSLEIYFPNANYNQNIDQEKEIKSYVRIENYISTLTETILENNGGIENIIIKGNPDFSVVSTINEGMYAIADDYGTSYYFRGAVDNNWVKFANVYWRIVRINGDNTIKLIYSGSDAPIDTERIVMLGNKTRIGTSEFNSINTLAEHAGYMYNSGEQRGLVTSSTIKTYLENWFATNLSSYDSKISDTIYCNDRNVVSGKFNGTTFNGSGIGQVGTWFAAIKRLVKENATYEPIGTGPSLLCPNKDDAFTKYDVERGNGKLSQKVGLLTVDEASIGGLITQVSGLAENNYLYTGNSYWLNTPSHFGIVSNNAFVFRVHSTGYLSTPAAHEVYDVRPVISLLPDNYLSGSGTWNDPYIVN